MPRKTTGNLRKKRFKNAKTLPRTSVVLLLLMVVAQLPLTLCCHPTFCLHYLFHFTGATLESLSSIESLKVGRRLSPSTIEFADGVVTLGHCSHETGVCRCTLE